MKNLSSVLNIILLVAVIVLFVLHFSDKKPSADQGAAEPVSVSDSVQRIPQDGQLRVAFVNMDVLLDNYKLYNELQSAMTSRQTQMEGQFEREATAFQQEYQQFMEKVERGGFLTQQSAEYAQNEIVKKQENLQQLEATLSSTLVKEQDDMTKRILVSIDNVIGQFNSQAHYDFIISNSLGGVLLFGDDSFNITDQVLSTLNQRYEASTTAQD